MEMVDLMWNDFLTLNRYHHLRRISTFSSLKYFGIKMNKSGGVVPKVLRFPSFKSLNCQPFPDFIDGHKSLLQLEQRMSFLLKSENFWSMNF